jgi:hypothetical protein
VPAHADFPPNVASTLPDPLAGDVYPKRPAPLPSPRDARTHALKGLFAYLSALRYVRQGATTGPETISFPVPADQLFVEWPDNVQALPFPSIVALDGRADYVGHGLGPPTVFGDTVGAAGPGTALIRGDEYVEDVRLEVWASTKGQRRGILAALEMAFKVSQKRGSLLITLPDYYGQTARFLPKERLLSGEDRNAIGRRTASFTVTMSVVTVAPVNVMPFRSQVTTTVGPDALDEE